VTSTGTGSFKNLIATDSLKIGSNGDAIASGSVSFSYEVIK